MKPNTCDLLCPTTVIQGLEHRLCAAKAGPLGRIAVNVGAGVEGAVQAGYAAFMCSSRKGDPTIWEPSGRCMSATVAKLDRMMPDLVDTILTPNEQIVLGPIITTLQRGAKPDGTPTTAW